MNEHAAPQLMLPSLLVTLPEPVPVVLTVNANCGEKVAATFTADVPIVNVQAPVPLQAPVQPANTEPTPAAGVKVTGVLVATEALQVPGQLIPFPVTVPEPVTLTFTANDVGIKSALTACTEFMVTEQAPVPVQAPLHPLKTDPAAAVGVKATTVP